MFRHTHHVIILIGRKSSVDFVMRDHVQFCK